MYILGTSGYGDIYSNNVCCVATKTNIYNLGSCNSQSLTLLIPQFRNNRYYTPNAGLQAKCGSETWNNLVEMQEHGMELGTQVYEPVSDDTVIQWGKDLLGL